VRDGVRTSERVDRGLAVFAEETLTQALLDIKRQVREWTDEELRERFMTLEGLEFASFAARACICSELARRRNGDLRAAAQFLGISYSYARKMSGLWQKVLSKLERPFQLPMSFYMEAYTRAEKHGIDPIEALEEAERRYLSGGYTVRRFREDLARQFDDRSGELEIVPLSCADCVHYVSAPDGAELVLMVGGQPVGRSSGEGIRYCAARGLLEFELGDPIQRARECERFQPREGGYLEDNARVRGGMEGVVSP